MGWFFGFQAPVSSSTKRGQHHRFPHYKGQCWRPPALRTRDLSINKVFERYSPIGATFGKGPVEELFWTAYIWWPNKKEHEKYTDCGIRQNIAFKKKKLCSRERQTTSLKPVPIEHTRHILWTSLQIWFRTFHCICFSTPLNPNINIEQPPENG